jgi:endothelin-converting enzyme/putative endopeptidase
VRPGDGFYHYINQKWLKKTQIPNSLSEFGASEEIEKRNKVHLLSLLKGLGKKEPNGIPKTSQDHLRFFSHVWSNSTYNAEEAFIKSVVGEILDCRNQQDIARMFGWLCSANISALLEVNTNVEKREPFHIRFTLCCSSLLLPSRYYLKRSMHTDPIWIAYNEYIYTCASELGMPFLFKAIEAESDIAHIFTMEANEKDSEFTGSRLERLCPDFLWSEFMHGVGISHWRQEKWIIKELKTIKHILRWISTAKTDKVVAILSLYLVNTYSKFMRPSIKEARFNLFQRKVRGISEPPTSEDEYLETLGSVLPEALCIEYSKINDPTKKSDLEDLVSKIKASAIDVMSNNHSLSKHTTAQTLEKIRRIKVSIGSPKQPDLPKAEYYSDSLIHTMLSLRKARIEQEFKGVGELLDHSTVSYPCHIVNASYFEDLNHIIIPWGILQWPFYHLDAPLGWNHGGIGATICHEMTHGFDLEGSLYSPRGTYKEWWTRKNRQMFKRQTRKVSRFFSKFKHYRKKLNGDNTLSENWADLGGLKIALHGLNILLENKTEKEKEEAHRNFFISYAVSWREITRKKTLLYSIMTSVHAPAEDRVDRIVPQFKEWVQAFNVKETDRLFLSERERLKFF